MSGVGVSENAVGKTYVVNRASNSVSVVNTSTQQVEKTIPVGTEPVSLVHTPDQSKAYVANYGSNSNSVSVIDTTALQVVTTIPVGLNPASVVVTPDGLRVYVANSGPGQDSVSIIDTTKDSLLATLPILRPTPSLLALSPDGKTLYVMGTGSRFIAVINTSTNQTGRIETGQDPVAVAFSLDGRTAYVANQGGNSVSIFDATTFPPIKLTEVPVGQGPRSLVVSPNGTKVYVANFLSDSLSVFSTALGDSSNALSVRSIQANATQPEVQEIRNPGGRGPYNIQTLPSSSIGAEKEKILVIYRNSDNVGVLDVDTDQFQSTVPVGSKPEQSALDPELPLTAVTNFSSNSLSFVNTSNTTASPQIQVGTAPVAVATILQNQQVVDEIRTGFESPESGPVSGIAVIRGWAFTTQPNTTISQVELFVDNISVGTIPCCSARADVQASFPQFPSSNTLSSGWGTTFNWGILNSGTHVVRVEFKSSSGMLSSTETRVVTVVKPGDFEFLDQFTLADSTASITNDELVVENITVRDKVSQQKKMVDLRFRWFANSQSLNTVESITLAQAFSRSVWFASLFSWLESGFMRAVNPINVQAALGIVATLESPEEGQAVSGISVIRGWAFDDTTEAPVREVRLLIDGASSIAIPCCSARDDVAATYPAVASARNSGWGATINYGVLSPGTHMIRVQVSGSNGAVFTLDRLATTVKVGGFEFLDQFDLSQALARVEGEEIVISNVRVRDKVTQQAKIVNLRLRWFENSQTLGIVSSVD